LPAPMIASRTVAETRPNGHRTIPTMVLPKSSRVNAFLDQIYGRRPRPSISAIDCTDTSALPSRRARLPLVSGLCDPCPRPDETLRRLRRCRRRGFDVAAGEAFGFLGPTVPADFHDADDRTVSPVTAGTLTVFGLDPAIMGRRFGPDWAWFAGRHTRQRAERPREPAHLRPLLRPAVARGPAPRGELLDFVQLTERSGDQVEPLSGGMKRAS